MTAHLHQGSSERSAYTVARINPFWRYAVALDHRPDIPAVPYWSKAAALAFFDDSVAHFPEARTVLLRRTGARRLEVTMASRSNQTEGTDA